MITVDVKIIETNDITGIRKELIQSRKLSNVAFSVSSKREYTESVLVLAEDGFLLSSLVSDVATLTSMLIYTETDENTEDCKFSVSATDDQGDIIDGTTSIGSIFLISGSDGGIHDYRFHSFSVVDGNPKVTVFTTNAES